MSIEAACIRVLGEALRADAVLAAQINRFGDSVFEGGPAPSLWISDAIGSDWGSKDHPGREVRCGITIVDHGPPDRITALAAAAEQVILQMPRTIDGWASGGAVITRARITRARDGQRTAIIDLRIRLMRPAI